MTDDPTQVEAGDLRRAAALIVHYGRGNEDGVKALFAETSTVQRPVPLILAILALTDEIVPAIYSEAGMQIVSQHVIRLAGMEDDQC